MTDQEREFHICKKIYEVIHLTFRHYIPLGKPLPESYFEVWRQIHGLVDSGVFDYFVREPILEDEVRQLDIFTHVSPDVLAEKSNGTPIDKKDTDELKLS